MHPCHIELGICRPQAAMPMLIPKAIQILLQIQCHKSWKMKFRLVADIKKKIINRKSISYVIQRVLENVVTMGAFWQNFYLEILLFNLLCPDSNELCNSYKWYFHSSELWGLCLMNWPSEYSFKIFHIFGLSPTLTRVFIKEN